MIKRWLSLLKKFLIAAICIFAICRFCHSQTEGFRCTKIVKNTYPISAANPSLDQMQQMNHLLDQKYAYLGRGLQSFSFISEDQTTVLKIFNNRYQTRIFWLNLLSYVKPLKNWSEKKIQTAKAKLHRNFLSYQIASEELKEETGLIYFHPAEGKEFKKNIVIIDMLGIEHPIDLNDTGFIFQKKAVLVYPYLKQLMEKKEIAKAKQALSLLIEFCIARYKKGIGDNDALIRTNFGFYQDLPMQIDVGPFYRNPALKEPALIKEEIFNVSLSLKHWLEQNYLELAQHLDEILEKL